mmetsp:Transcript_4259/g.12177  ORF Transcript_4259/g.12177 Transcript_4259/m.12177 type:complete len:311 (+) Transcript_4259:1633-2565(+)
MLHLDRPSSAASAQAPAATSWHITIWLGYDARAASVHEQCVGQRSSPPASRERWTLRAARGLGRRGRLRVFPGIFILTGVQAVHSHEPRHILQPVGVPTPRPEQRLVHPAVADGHRQFDACLRGQVHWDFHIVHAVRMRAVRRLAGCVEDGAELVHKVAPGHHQPKVVGVLVPEQIIHGEGPVPDQQRAQGEEDAQEQHEDADPEEVAPSAAHVGVEDAEEGEEDAEAEDDDRGLGAGKASKAQARPEPVPDFLARLLCEKPVEARIEFKRQCKHPPVHDVIDHSANEHHNVPRHVAILAQGNDGSNHDS